MGNKGVAIEEAKFPHMEKVYALEHEDEVKNGSREAQTKNVKRSYFSGEKTIE